MSGSLGGGKSKSSQQSTSSSFGFNQSESQDVSASRQESLSGGSGTSSTTQNIAFEDLYAKLFGNASAAGESAVAQAPELAAAARQLFSGGTQFMQGLGGDAGTSYLTDRLSGNNPVLDEQINLLREDTGKLFSEQLNPAITSRAVAGGTLGGGRQGVAQGMAAEAAANSFARGASQLRSEDIARRDSAAATVAQNSLQAASTGLGALPGLLDLADRGVNAELGIYSNIGSILGGPTVLSQSQSEQSQFSRSTAQSAAEAFSRSFGQQTSASQASGKSKSWNFDTSASFL